MAFGRPPKYSNPEDMQRLIDLYFIACKAHATEDDSLLAGMNEEDLLVINDIDDVIPTVSGLAYLLGMTTVALRDYEKKDDFLSTVKRAKQRIEISLEQRLAGNNVTGAIFNLKNNYGWKDKQDVGISGDLGITFNMDFSGK